MQQLFEDLKAQGHLFFEEPGRQCLSFSENVTLKFVTQAQTFFLEKKLEDNSFVRYYHDKIMWKKRFLTSQTILQHLDLVINLASYTSNQALLQYFSQCLFVNTKRQVRRIF